MSRPEELMPGIWLERGDEGRPNEGLVVARGSAVRVDPRVEAGWPAALDDVTTQAGAVVVAAVFTHSDEHVHMARWGDAALVSPQAGSGFGGLSVVLPLSGWEVTTLQDGTRIGVYGRTSGVLFCGDMLTGKDVPSLRSGSDAYLESLERVEKLSVRLLIPAYGEPALGKREIRARIERERNYIYSVVRHVGSTMVSGISLDRALEAARSAYEDYPFVEQHAANISSVWREMLDLREE